MGNNAGMKFGHEVSRQGTDYLGVYYEFKFDNGYSATVRQEKLIGGFTDNWEVFVLYKGKVLDEFELLDCEHYGYIAVSKDSEVTEILEAVSNLEMEEKEMTNEEKLVEMVNAGWGYFEEKNRDNREMFLVVKEDAPYWVRELVDRVHTELGYGHQNDWIYFMIRKNFLMLEETAFDEWIDIRREDFQGTSDLVSWFHDKWADRMELVDDQIEKGATSLSEALNKAYQLEFKGVRFLMLEYLYDLFNHSS